MKVLVTGGAGFIGSHIIEHFNSIDNCHVRVLDNFRTGFHDNLTSFDIELIEGSILDRSVVREAVSGVDYVFHLAAMVSVPESMENPIECTNLNTIGLLNVLEEAASTGVKKLCLSSSSAIYGNDPVIPKKESMIPNPISPYAISKLDGEYYYKIFNDEGRVQTTSFRYFNVFGERQDPNSQYAAAIPKFIEQALNNVPLTVFGDGNQTRDFIYVKDIVAANVFGSVSEHVCETYNVAYGKKMTIRELAQKIITLTGSQSCINYLDVRPGDVMHSVASVDKIKDSGFEPSYSFDEGLMNTINFFMNIYNN